MDTELKQVLVRLYGDQIMDHIDNINNDIVKIIAARLFPTFNKMPVTIIIWRHIYFSS